MDSLYNTQLRAGEIYSPIDPSIYFFVLPTAVAVDRIWKQGQIPLWNPDNACGHPIMANIESGVFSWHHFLFPSSSQYMYNLGIVARLLVAATGTYFFARSFNLLPIYASVASIAYSLCPHIMREIELTKETWCFPWVLLLFMTVGKKQSLKHLIALASACALLCATIHPECSFNIIMVSSFMLTVQRCIESKPAGLSELGRTVFSSTAWLLLVGLCTFCFAAPVLLPFAEFMRNSDCYKFAGSTPPVVALPAFLLTLVHPAMNGSSAFLGVFCIPSVVLAFYKPRREVISLLLTTVLAISVASLIGPLAELFKHNPFNMLEPHYLQPICMLLLACLMAEGFQKLAQAENRLIPIFLFTSACIAAIAVPLALGYFKVPLSSLDWEIEKYTIVWGAWKKDAALAIGSCLLLALSTHIKISNKRTVEIVMLAALLSQLTISRMSLPVHPNFNYEAVGPVSWLQRQHGRVMAMGRHFIIPNINLIWGLSDFRHFNGLYAPRYLNFQSLCGARCYYLTHYRYEDSLTNVIDLASVKFITSRAPVYSTSDLRNLLKAEYTPVATMQEPLEILSTPVQYDSDLKQALCLLRWKCSDEFKNNHNVQFAVLSEANNEIWTSDEFLLTLGDQNVPEISQAGRWLIPDVGIDEKPLKLVLRINNSWSNGPVWPLKSKLGSVKNNVVIATLNPKSHEASVLKNPIQKRFRLSVELPDGTRVYENKQALPEAYAVPAFNANFARDKKEASKLILADSFNARTSVILEAERKIVNSHVADKKRSNNSFNIAQNLIQAEVNRPNSNQVEVTVDCPYQAYVVLTDTFYPGWKAYLNGSQNQVEIVRANYLFRAVLVPEGKSTISFKYQPQSLTNGLILFGLVCLAFLALFIKQHGSDNQLKTKAS